jgi:hypothetical protein
MRSAMGKRVALQALSAKFFATRVSFREALGVRTRPRVVLSWLYLKSDPNTH